MLQGTKGSYSRTDQQKSYAFDNAPTFSVDYGLEKEEELCVNVLHQ